VSFLKGKPLYIINMTTDREKERQHTLSRLSVTSPTQPGNGDQEPLAQDHPTLGGGIQPGADHSRGSRSRIRTGQHPLNVWCPVLNLNLRPSTFKLLCIPQHVRGQTCFMSFTVRCLHQAVR
jgi:hypothetical protein